MSSLYYFSRKKHNTLRLGTTTLNKRITTEDIVILKKSLTTTNFSL